MDTLNVNGLSTTITRKRLPEWIEKQDKTMHYFQEGHFEYRDVEMSQVKMWKTLSIPNSIGNRDSYSNTRERKWNSRQTNLVKLKGEFIKSIS